MASLRSLTRLAPRAQFIRPAPIARVTVGQLQSTRFASTTETGPKEQASEELIMQPGEDVNMVRTA
jgi:NADH dehydrogenase (ubiquinone) 1 beta subcomplex subunit 8